MKKLYNYLFSTIIICNLLGCEGTYFSATEPEGWIDKQQIFHESSTPSRGISSTKPRLNPHIGFVTSLDDQSKNKTKALIRLGHPVKIKACEHLDYECTELECKSLQKLK